MPLTNALRSYDSRWPEAFEAEAAGLCSIVGPDLKAIHHVGSTAVPGLAAKPEIDILAIVARTTALDRWTRELVDRGYKRGGDLSTGHHFFKRDVGQVRTHKLHVCVAGHPMAVQMLRFRDHLRLNPSTRLQYQDLKFRLERENRFGIQQYLAGKAPFIRSILDEIG